MNHSRISIGKDKAIELASTNWWELCSPREIAEFQLFTNELCMPFAVFHEAVEKSLGRSVWTHEFAYIDGIIAEFLGERPAPTIVDILRLIPENKRIIVNL